MSFNTNSSPYGGQKFLNASPNPMGAPPAIVGPLGWGKDPLPQGNPVNGIQDAVNGYRGSSLWQSAFGKPERDYQRSTLTEEQRPLFEQLLQSAQNRGAGGAFGDSADYYRDILSNDPAAMEAFMAPELRRFREQIIPGLAEQFSGPGQIEGSGFRNAAIGAGTDLSERLGSIRANLRQQSARGLADIGREGLGGYSEGVYRPETFGFIGNLAEAAAEGAGKGLVSGGIPGVK